MKCDAQADACTDRCMQRQMHAQTNKEVFDERFLSYILDHKHLAKNRLSGAEDHAGAEALAETVLIGYST